MTINSLKKKRFAGSIPEASFGCAALPTLEVEFRNNFDKTLEYAKAFNCKKWVFLLLNT